MKLWNRRGSASTPLLSFLLLFLGCQIAAADYRLSCAAGGVCTFKSTTAAGVDTPHVMIDSGGSGGNGGTNSTFDTAFPASGTAVGISDGTNMKSWLAAVALSPTAGVNGNNMGTVVPWLWNGSAYVATPGDATNGAFVNIKSSVLPIGTVPTDRTITSASGASQTLMAANAARRALVIQNTGNANCGVNRTGGTAAIGGAGTLTLFPGGSFTPRSPSLSAITVICTAGQPIYADEQ